MHLNSKTSKSGKKIYEYYSLASSYRDTKGVSRKNILHNLGKLTAKEAKDWRFRLSVYNGDITELLDMKKVQYVESKRYLDVALLSSIYDQLGFHKVFNKYEAIKKIGLSEVAKILIISRCLDPQANYRTVDWFKDSYLPDIMGVDHLDYNKDKLFRELSEIHLKKGLLQKHFLEFSKKNNNGAELYFFDATTSYFEGVTCELATGAMDKTAGYQNKVILIGLLTDKKGYPIAWDIFSGDKREVKEFQKIAKKLCGEMEIKEATFCFDRGIASKANFQLIEDVLESKYISGLDRNQIASIFSIDSFGKQTRDKLIAKFHEIPDSSKKEKKIITSTDGFYRLGKVRFYKDLGVTKGKRYVVSFNVKIFERESTLRQQRVELFKRKMEALNEDLKGASQDRNDNVVEKKISDLLAKNYLTSAVDYKIIPTSRKVKRKSKIDNIQTFRIAYDIDEKKINELALSDGILVYITNHIEPSGADDGQFKVTAADIVRHYKDKYVIENAFRHLKSFLDLRPFFVRIEEHIRAHVDICMAAYFINNYIYHAVKEIDLSLEDFYQKIEPYSRVCHIADEKKALVLMRTLPRDITRILDQLNAKNTVNKGVLKKYKITKN